MNNIIPLHYNQATSANTLPPRARRPGKFSTASASEKTAAREVRLKKAAARDVVAQSRARLRAWMWSSWVMQRLPAGR